MEMKNILVLFHCSAAVRQTLTEAVQGMATVTFREGDWSVETYREALEKAHIIIGEPRNEEFVYCKNLQLMHSPSSGVNYYVDGGKFLQIYSDWQLLCFSSAAYNWQPPENSENLTEYDNAQAICDWIREQSKIRNFPKFDDAVEDIEPRPTNPQIMGVDVNGIAKYAVGIRVIFKGKMV